MKLQTLWPVALKTPPSPKCLLLQCCGLRYVLQASNPTRCLIWVCSTADPSTHSGFRWLHGLGEGMPNEPLTLLLSCYILNALPRGSIYTTIMELGPQNHNGDGLLGPNSIIVVYMDPLGCIIIGTLRGVGGRGVGHYTSVNRPY